MLDTIEGLCNRGGDGVQAAAVRMEIVELRDHPYFVGVQYHPEYLSTPFHPSPPILGLILASIGKLDSYLEHKFSSEVEQLKEGVIFEASAVSIFRLLIYLILELNRKATCPNSFRCSTNL